MLTSGVDPSKPLLRRNWLIIVLAVVIVVLLAVSLIPLSSLTSTPSTQQKALNEALGYLAENYNYSLGLIPQAPGSNTYLLYPDNYLAALAASRYTPSNQTTDDFALSLETAVTGYSLTAPSDYVESAYTALNSTRASFSCPQSYSLSWSILNSSEPVKGSAVLETAANDGSRSCASYSSSDNYASLLFLQALLYNRQGNTTKALLLYDEAEGDFDGKGFMDAQFTTPGTTDTGQYQTSNLALFVYATSCLGQTSSNSDFQGSETILMSMQDNATGGFYSGYGSSLQATLGITTQATALSALALEQLISPSKTC